MALLRDLQDLRKKIYVLEVDLSVIDDKDVRDMKERELESLRTEFNSLVKERYIQKL